MRSISGPHARNYSDYTIQDFKKVTLDWFPGISAWTRLPDGSHDRFSDLSDSTASHDRSPDLSASSGLLDGSHPDLSASTRPIASTRPLDRLRTTNVSSRLSIRLATHASRRMSSAYWTPTKPYQVSLNQGVTTITLPVTMVQLESEAGSRNPHMPTDWAVSMTTLPAHDGNVIIETLDNVVIARKWTSIYRDHQELNTLCETLERHWCKGRSGQGRCSLPQDKKGRRQTKSSPNTQSGTFHFACWNCCRKVRYRAKVPPRFL
jgi:hypothetical protein